MGSFPLPQHTTSWGYESKACTHNSEFDPQKIFEPGFDPKTINIHDLHDYLSRFDFPQDSYYHHAAAEFRQDKYNPYEVGAAFDNSAADYAHILFYLIQYGHLSKDTKVLEIGAAVGNVVHLLQQWKLPAVGMELNPDMINFARSHGVNLVQGNFLDPRARQQLDVPFDIVFGYRVLDAVFSLKNPGRFADRSEEYQALMALSSFTKMNGLIITGVRRDFFLPFTNEELELAGFEIIFREDDFDVILKKVREPASVEQFAEFRLQKGEEIDRIGNARIQYFINTTSTTDLRDIVSAMRERPVGPGQPLTSEKLMGWIHQHPILQKVYERRKPELEKLEERGFYPIPRTPKRDEAMVTDAILEKKSEVGGINFNPDLLDLQIKRDKNGVPLPLPQQPIGEMKIEGLFPVIMEITPVDLPLLLGVVEKKDQPRASVSTFSFPPGNFSARDPAEFQQWPASFRSQSDEG